MEAKGSDLRSLYINLLIVLEDVTRRFKYLRLETGHGFPCYSGLLKAHASFRMGLSEEV